MIIYMARNKTNGKVYIGQTSISLAGRKSDHRRKAFKYGSRAAFHTAIREFGFDCFEWEILESLSSDEQANVCEQGWIEKYKSTDPHYGYNNTNGGTESFQFTKDVLHKIGEAGKGRKPSEAQRRAASIRMRGAGNPFFGKHHTEEAKTKNRAAHLGKKLTPEHIAKCIHRGSSNHRSRINEHTAREIKIALRDGQADKAIRETFEINKDILQGIKKGKSWAWVEI